MKQPFIPADQLKQIARAYPTPFYLYDERGIRENARRIRQAFSWNPGYQQYFAVKAAPTPALLKLLREEGIYAECSSKAELELARRCGFYGDEILFVPNDPLEEDVKAAAGLKTAVNLDDINLIGYFQKYRCLPERVGLRYNPGGVFSIDGQDISQPGQAKFGFTRPQIFEGVEKLMKLGVKSIGLHGYMGGNIGNPGYYEALARMLFHLAVEVNQKTGMPVSFINLSGGIGIAYRPKEETPDIFAVGESVRVAFHEIMVPAGLGHAKLYTELGRYMTGPYGLLVSTVLHKKKTYKNYIGLDACAAHLMRPMLYGAYHHITIAGKENAPHGQIYDVTGSICENTDKFAVDRHLPEIEIGDLVVIHDVGAHGHSMGYNYNGKLRCAELLYCCDGSVKVIRRAETMEDYFATMIF